MERNNQLLADDLTILHSMHWLILYPVVMIRLIQYKQDMKDIPNRCLLYTSAEKIQNPVSAWQETKEVERGEAN